MKQLSTLITFAFFSLLLTACNSSKHTTISRQQLKMPRLIEFENFKNELPVVDLKSFRVKARTDQLFNYFFTIDKNGNVIDGKFDQSADVNFNFLRSYVTNTFNHYKWRPAYYDVKEREELKSVLKLSIYDNPDKKILNISIRLMYLPGKEKLDNIFEQRNLIYKIIIK